MPARLDQSLPPLKKLIIEDGAGQNSSIIQLAQTKAAGPTYSYCLTMMTRLEGIEVTTLIDPGASGNFLHRRIADKLPHLYHQKKEIGVTGFTSDTLDTVKGDIRGATLIVDEIHEEIIATDVIDMKYDLVLGMTWMRKHNPEVDWRTRKLSFTRCTCIKPAEPTIQHAWVWPVLANMGIESLPPEYQEFQGLCQEKFGSDALLEYKL